MTNNPTDDELRAMLAALKTTGVPSADARERWPLYANEKALCDLKEIAPWLATTLIEYRQQVQELKHWLASIAENDMNEIVADGGITAAMVVQQEAREYARRLTKESRV